MTHEPDAEDTGWDRGFDGHTLAQRRRLARLSITEKLDWLEEAHRFVRELQAKRAADPDAEAKDPPRER